MTDNPAFSKLELHLQQDLLRRLTISAELMGVSVADLAEQALRRFLFTKQGGNAVFLSPPIIELVEGFYVENTNMADMKEHGDIGLGTFNYIDGEMVILDGNVYRIRSDGVVYSVKDDEQSPFACVTFFSPDTFEDIEEDHNSQGFHDLLNALIPSENMLYAIRIDGSFSHVRTRAVPRSENYKPLIEATANQPVFDFSDAKGYLA